MNFPSSLVFKVGLYPSFWEPIDLEAFQAGISKVLGGRFSANDCKYMVLQGQESDQGLLNMAVKVKEVLVFKEQHGVLFIFAPN